MLIYHKKSDGIVAGIDEAGRGCLAGPVVAAAVILPHNYKINHLNDSKKLTEALRKELRYTIESNAITYGIGVICAPTIDSINILEATYLAMHEAINQLSIAPNRLLIDGNRYKPAHIIPYQTIIKGDGKFASIAAASILAKTYRDDIMQQASYIHNQYNWEINKGYPTLLHRKQIQEIGTTPIHRQSFRIK